MPRPAFSSQSGETPVTVSIADARSWHSRRDSRRHAGLWDIRTAPMIPVASRGFCPTTLARHNMPPFE